MTQSLPSKKTVYVDAPEVPNFSGKFIYNFFTRAERLDDSGNEIIEDLRERPSENLNATVLDSINFKRFIPRFVKFQWRPVPVGNRPDISNTVSIKNNINKIHSEESFISDEFTNISFQDSGQDQKLQYFITRQLTEVITDQNNVDSAKNLQDAKTRERLIKGSQLDIVKFLNTNTSNNISGNFLSKAFTQMKNNGILFLKKNDPNLDVLSSQFQNRLNKVKIKAQLNNKFVNTIVKTSQNNTISLFKDEIESIITQTQSIQEKALTQKDSSMLNGSDYDFEFYDFIDFKSNIDPNSFDSTVQVVGYVIEKKEYFSDGTSIERDPIVVENQNASTTADVKIKYGSTYGYKIKSIVYVELAVEDSEYNSISALSFLVSSKPSNEIIVKTEEYIAPPEVADFKVAWDYFHKAARLTWSFPPNSQRDIKYFQVFRRTSIEEPFELIKMYDFNDSLVPLVLPETPDKELIEKLSSPVCYYLDKEFTKESKYIYSICAIDAHGYSSNYSIQFECYFDKFANKILIKPISLAGAPKAYPNAFLLRDTFADTIRDSNHTNLEIIFNPEFMQVYDNNNNDLKVLKTDQNSSYKIQMINVDLQTQQTIEIKLIDNRR